MESRCRCTARSFLAARHPLNEYTRLTAWAEKSTLQGPTGGAHGAKTGNVGLVPTRESIPEYTEYRDAVMRRVEAINDRFGTPAWQPVKVFYEQNRLQSLAALQLADVLLVNSLLVR